MIERTRNADAPLDARVHAALVAMRTPASVTHVAAERVAAHAILANAPARRATRRSMLAAAALAIVALSSLAARKLTQHAPPLAIAAVVLPAAPPVTAPALRPVRATGARPIVFELDAPGARAVQVIGDFNDWSRSTSSMQQGSDGRWRITTLLPPGRYVYAFLIDGQRFRRDPQRMPVEDRDFGITGSELVVGEAP
ncbi:MAG: isoamylase early set domain-containing protein [Gemmatimonadaceae bacterium]|nr:isoamylase early set domain-containing protein [Gemmatimonadaceae bacterium]